LGVIGIAILAVGLGVVSVVCIDNIDSRYMNLLKHPQKRFEYLRNIETSCFEMQLAREALSTSSDAEWADKCMRQMELAHADATDYITAYLNSTDSTQELWSSDEIMLSVQQLVDRYKTHTPTGMEEVVISEIFASLNELVKLTELYVDLSIRETATIKDAYAIMIILMAACIVFASVAIGALLTGLAVKAETTDAPN
jgi:hypothetical protein